MVTRTRLNATFIRTLRVLFGVGFSVTQNFGKKKEKFFFYNLKRQMEDNTRSVAHVIVRMLKSRKYCETYLPSGLTNISVDGKEEPWCIICNNTH